MRTILCICAVIATSLAATLTSVAASAQSTGQDPYQDRTADTRSSYDPNTRRVTVSASSGGNSRTNNQSGNANRPGNTPTEGPTCETVDKYRLCPMSDKLNEVVTPAGQAAREAAAQLQLPANEPLYGPDPNQNQWHMIPVGYPVWLWTINTTTRVTITSTSQGFTISITATQGVIVFDTGDGHTTNCQSTTVRPTHLTPDPMRRSPTCDHVYYTKGTFTITATTIWHVIWAANGETGSFDVTDKLASSKPLPIGELRTVIVPDPTNTP